MPAPVAGHTFSALGTFATVLTTDAAALEPAQAFLATEVHAMDVACSRFRRDSELWRVNQAQGRPVQISPLFAEALMAALTAARLSNGDVDPTCGNALVRLGYDRDFAQVRNNTSTLRQRPAPAPGWRSVELDPVLREVRVPSGAVLDLGATTKALAADRAAVGISATLGCGILVNLGGDIRVAGPPPADGWRIGIGDDVAFDGSGSADPASRAVLIRDGGLATSGTAVRSWQRGAARFHHIIVPGTGLPARSCWCAVSVAAATCVAANTASTAAIIRGEPAAGWLAGLGLPARLVRHGGEAVTVAGLAGRPPMTTSLHGPGLWYATRAAGLVSLLLLTVSVLLGVLTAGRFSTERWPRFLTAGLHRNLSLLVVVFLALHVGTTVLDSYVPIPVTAAFVPFISAYKTFWLGLGAVAADLLLALLVTSLVRNRLGLRSWRRVHWLAYACWPIGLAHGLGIGTDRDTTWVFALTIGCASMVAAATTWRLVTTARAGAR